MVLASATAALTGPVDAGELAVHCLRLAAVGIALENLLQVVNHPAEGTVHLGANWAMAKAAVRERLIRRSGDAKSSKWFSEMSFPPAKGFFGEVRYKLLFRPR